MKNTETSEAKKAWAEVCAAARPVVAEAVYQEDGPMKWERPQPVRRLCAAIDAWRLATDGYIFNDSGVVWSAEGERQVADIREVMACRAFIRRFMTPTARIQRSVTSYGWKHQVERWCRSEDHPFHPGGGGHISNGAFIAAACLLYVPMAPVSHGHPNMCFALKLAREAGR